MKKKGLCSWAGRGRAHAKGRLSGASRAARTRPEGATDGRNELPERGYNMKITVNIDCTPAEAREFMGLPDLRPMQAGIMEDLEKMMRDNVDKLSPDSILRTWLALTPDALQETFKTMLNLATTGKSSK
jgi:Family of unknown function (DUF6489)